MRYPTNLTSISETASCHLKNISRLEPVLSDFQLLQLKPLFMPFIASHLDYCNDAPFGRPITALDEFCSTFKTSQPHPYEPPLAHSQFCISFKPLSSPTPQPGHRGVSARTATLIPRLSWTFFTVFLRVWTWKRWWLSRQMDPLSEPLSHTLCDRSGVFLQVYVILTQCR